MPLRTRRWWWIVIAVALLVCPACHESDLFVPNGTLSATMGGGLTFQTSDVEGNQIMSWDLETVEIQVPDQDLFDYLEVAPCTYIQNVAFFTALSTQCGVQGFVLDEGTYPSTMQVSVSKMTVYRAWRPPLPDGQDCDTDTVINEMDNCPLIPNPMQEDINMDGFGDACSLNDPTTGQPIIPDRDGDRIADFADNCVWVPNTDQDDMDAGTFLRGIGDACQDEADVMLPQMPTVFNFPNPNFPVLDIPIQNGDITFALVDFSSDPSEMDAPVTCTTTQPMNCGDAPSMLTSCTLDDQLVQVNVF